MDRSKWDTFNERGQFIPDPTPVEVPLKLRRPLSLQDEIKRFVRSELSQRAEDEGYESFEESDDFDIDDDEGEFASPYEFQEMTPEAGDRDASNLRTPEPPAKPSEPPEKAAGAASTAAPDEGKKQ